jgi:beta-glucosidase/6-phospho-beta-glucosidase/beta-galactosidase
MKPFLLALALVESSNNTNAIGDDGLSWGLYQIRPVYVEDVNRILGVNMYRHIDAMDPTHAQAMVVIYIDHYATPERLGRPVTDEDRARIHNGGPTGWKKRKTVKFWKKVKKVMDEPH